MYSILCVWGLALSYPRYNPDHHHTYLLNQSVVKLMRGMLAAMMLNLNKQLHLREKSIFKSMKGR